VTKSERFTDIYEDILLAFQFLILCVCFVDRCFHLAIVLYVLLPCTDSDYLFDIFKLLLLRQIIVFEILKT
jgi:hypothetical protein